MQEIVHTWRRGATSCRPALFRKRTSRGKSRQSAEVRLEHRVIVPERLVLSTILSGPVLSLRPQYAATANRNFSLSSLRQLKRQGFLSKGSDWEF